MPTVRPGRGSVGAGLARREDPPLLDGSATFTGDIDREGMVHLALVRSTVAHAGIESVETDEAAAIDGVVAVYTAADVAAGPGIGSLGPTRALPGGDDDPVRRITSPLVETRQPLLADGVVRYVGEPVAAVVAEDRYTARDAVEAVRVDYDRRPAVPTPVAAVEDDAVSLHAEAPDNIAFGLEVGDEDVTDAAFERADHTVDAELAHQRVVPTAIEPRGVVAEYDPGTNELEIWLGTQGPHRHLEPMAAVTGVPENRIRVRGPHVGGAFGSKGKSYPDDALAAWCSVRLGRPVRWQATRTESFQADTHGRGHTSWGELALDADGQFLALRGHSRADVGGYCVGSAASIHTTSFTDMLSNQYRLPTIYGAVEGVFTSRTPVDAYRGTSRPQAVLLVERLVDRAAAALDLDPAEIRRRNFIPPEAFPYATPVGVTYDSGRYEHALDRALELAGYEERRRQQAEARTEGRYLGIGIACTLDGAGGAGIEGASVSVHPDGSVTAHCGTFDHGQGHRTTFAQLVATELGVPVEACTVAEGDTAALAVGSGTGGSRSAMSGGGALVACTDQLIERGRAIAASRLEAAPEDIEFADGEFSITGAPARSVTIKEIARLAYNLDAVPEGTEPGLEVTAYRSTPGAYPFAAHVAVVELDAETGEVDLLDYVAVDDCGTQINPEVVEGQIHGGVAQGVGQALLEGAAFDENATPITSSLQDYALPRATLLPDLVVDSTVTESPHTVHGVKGIGESGTISAPAAVTNAVVDALPGPSQKSVALPFTSESVWTLLDERGR